jgi:hypothetical protein
MNVTLGNRVRINYTARDESGTLADPDSLTIRISRPRQPATEQVFTYGVDSEIVKDGVGQYHAIFNPPTEGRWRYYWVGSPDGATEGGFRVTLNYAA